MSVVTGTNNNNNGSNSNNSASATVGGWIRNSVARSSFGRRTSAAASSSTSSGAGWNGGQTASNWLGVGAELDKVDPSAAYYTFSKHWQQMVEIMDRTRQKKQVFQDDVTAVINHLGQMVTLLQVDIRQIMTKDRPTNGETTTASSARATASTSVSDTTGVCTTSFVSSPSTSTTVQSKPYCSAPSMCSTSLPPLEPPPTPIFDHFLGEEILDKVLEWSLGTGEFANSLKLEQLKIHEILLCQSRQELLVYKPVIRPLIRLLDSCLSCIPVEVERHLVLLLNQLCASLLHNQQLLHFFFLSSPNEQGDAKFLIFSLLLPFVHREGTLGQQARDALLLCMALSSTNPPVGQYIADTSNFCPLLAAGMCGLYSTLPRSLPASLTAAEGWHRIAPRDIPSIPNLQVFLNALEFCNAVVQVGHPLVRNELVELVYQGFLVLVLGPALHQDGAVSETQQDLAAPPANIDEVVTATAYVELFLSYATEPQLRRAFLAFLLTPPPPHGEEGAPKGDITREPPVSTTLISRLHSDNTRVCLVTLQLFIRVLDCWCEDAMVALVFQYLLSGSHVMVSHRASATHHAPLYDAHRILDLMPAVLKHEEECNLCSDLSCTSPGGTKNGNLNGVPYSLMLQTAQGRIHRAAEACSKWTWKYDGVRPSPSQAVRLLEVARSRCPQPYPKLRSISDPTNRSTENIPNPLLLGVSSSGDRRNSVPSPVAAGGSGNGGSSSSSSSGVGCGKSVNNRSMARKSQQLLQAGVPLTHPNVLNLSNDDDQPESLGESSGYESFNIRTSRDSSPSSPPSSPRSQNASSSSGAVGRSGHRDSRSLPRQQDRRNSRRGDESESSEQTEVDQAFLEELLAWELTGPQEDAEVDAPSTDAVPREDTTQTESSEQHEDTTNSRDLNRRRRILEAALLEIDSAFDLYVPQSPKRAPSQESSTPEVNWDEPAWSCPPSPPSSPPPPHARPTIGPFLEAVVERVETILQTSVPVTQLLFALLLRLASCPAPILTSLLLHPALLCQPAVRSLYQVLSSVKQRIDSCLSDDDAHLLAEARAWFTARQRAADDVPDQQFQVEPVKMIAQHHLQTVGSATHPDHAKQTTDTGKDGSRKRSLTATVTGAMGALFKRSFPSPLQQGDRRQREPALQNLPHNTGYRYFRQSSDSSGASLSPAPSVHTHASSGSSTPTPSPAPSPATLHRNTPSPLLTPSSVHPTPNASGSQSIFYTSNPQLNLNNSSSIYDTSSFSLPVTYEHSLFSSESLLSSTSQSLSSSIHHHHHSSLLSAGGSDPTTSPPSTLHPVGSEEGGGSRRPVHSYNHEKVHAARCAVLLRQLLLELSALAQEHAVYTPVMIFDWRSGGTVAAPPAPGDGASKSAGGSAESARRAVSRSNSSNSRGRSSVARSSSNVSGHASSTPKAYPSSNT